MAHDAVTCVKAHAFGSVARKAVMLVLADYADAAWSTFVGQARLAFETDLGERTVRRLLAELEQEGLLRREPRYVAGHRTSDRITLQRSLILDLPANVAAITLHLPANDGSIPATDDSHTGQALAGEPSVEPSDKNSPANERDDTAQLEAVRQLKAQKRRAS